jgi:hypothetical protein
MLGLKTKGRILAVPIMLGLGGGFLGGGCSSESCASGVVSRADPAADFSAYHTFAIADIDAASLGGASGMGGSGGRGFDIPDDVLVNIDSANREAAKQLVAGGLEQVEPGETPDLLIASAANTTENNGVVWECVPGWYWWGWTVYWDSCAWLTPVHVEYTTGTLVVAVGDTKTNKVVFGGVASGVLDCGQDVQGQVISAVDEIFADYPFAK